MKRYIFGKRNLIHIVDVRETVKGLVRASNFLRQIAALGKDAVYVGTKRQAKSLIMREAQRAGMHWVSERWLGGTLTNFHTIRSRLKRLEELEALEQDGTIEQYSKKRISALRRERRKILRNLEGLRKMKELPGCLVVVDVRTENIAVREARKVGIPVVALVDTDCDPRDVDIVIPGNDDAYRSIQVILRVLTDAIIAGRDKYIVTQAELRRSKEQAEAAPAKPAVPTTRAGERPAVATRATARPPATPDKPPAATPPPQPPPSATQPERDRRQAPVTGATGAQPAPSPPAQPAPSPPAQPAPPPPPTTPQPVAPEKATESAEKKEKQEPAPPGSSNAAPGAAGSPAASAPGADPARETISSESASGTPPGGNPGGAP
jgi:small subunit ribosomal protein S2